MKFVELSFCFKFIPLRLLHKCGHQKTNEKCNFCCLTNDFAVWWVRFNFPIHFDSATFVIFVSISTENCVAVSTTVFNFYLFFNRLFYSPYKSDDLPFQSCNKGGKNKKERNRKNHNDCKIYSARLLIIQKTMEDNHHF